MVRNRRSELLSGILYPPKQIEDIVNHKVFSRFFDALWHNYLLDSNKTTSSTYWSDEFDDHKAFNRALLHLSDAGWIESTVIPKRNWATVKLREEKLLQWVTEEELIDIRKFFKFEKYKMNNTESTVSNVAKTPKGLKHIGISRPGQAKAGNNKFKYDISYLTTHWDAILLNLTKSIDKAIEKHNLTLDGADYKSIATEILEYHLYSPEEEFTLGMARLDSRGRAISNVLGKVFNPFGSKDARALLVGPEVSFDKEGFKQVYLAVSELLGCKLDTVAKRISFAKKAIQERTLLTLDLSHEKDRADLHINIWLERIYEAIKSYNGHNWTVPIELDAQASVLQIMGTLLGDESILDETNVINAKTLKDIWSKGMPRMQFKIATTPLLYGSTAHCTKLWTKKKVAYTAEQVKLHKKALATGPLSIANDFKDYIIDNVVPKPTMDVTIGEETFKIYCNKYMNVGEYTKKYPLYDTKSKTIVSINHTHTKQVPDLEAFKRYFVTLLVHNRDSKIADNVCLNIDWILPLYDAFIVMPDEALATRREYAKELKNLYDTRVSTLDNYFNSIGIPHTVGTHKEWVRLQEKITNIPTFNPSIYALK